ncbi:agamous-like MADS-box protein AGL81 [Nicotiana tabacum]|uniref:Agamous-like MADS-box protein AGL81 n=1 Tax=Nicotiana tabacum TaxID=4097 RepID=A0A1S3XD89_TOBAC|nr:PREDICTED: agamous-like MADS-box protein AGL81 [Nicotiana tabacum]
MAEENQNKKKTNNPKTYQVRKECIKRKTMELSTLCDIKCCTIITSPQGELQTWPENLDAVKEVLNMYTQTLSPNKKEEEIDIPTLVDSKLDAVNKRIRYLENKNAGFLSNNKGKKQRIE